MPQTCSSREILSRSKAVSVWREIILLAWWILENWLGPGTGAKSWYHSVPITSRALGTAHLDRRVYTTCGNHGKMRVAFNDVYDAAIAFKNIDQLARVLIPHEPIAVVRSRHDIFIIRAKKIH